MGSNVGGASAGLAPGGGQNGTGGTTGGTSASMGGRVSLGGGIGEGGAFQDQTLPQNIEKFRIEPENAVVTVKVGASVAQTFHAFATMKGSVKEVDITDRTVFYVPDNYLVGGFPLDGAPLFTSRLPMKADDPPQRGGVVTVQAQAANSEGDASSVSTSLTVQLVGALTPPANSAQNSPTLPATPETHFQGTANAANAPQLVYPNDGTLLPPNLGTLEVHFKRGNAANSLFEIAFTSKSSDIRFYTRCASDAALFEAGACSYTLDQDTYAYVADSNRGVGPVELAVRGSNESGAFGESAKFALEFSENRVDGAVYYWAASNPPRIMRTDFNSNSALEEFLKPSTFKDDAQQVNGACVGCHILSRDGTKLAASIGNSADGRLAYIQDLAVPRSDPAWLTVNPASASGPANANRILTGSFNPSGSQFVAVAPRNDAKDDNTLFFHNGNTGLREGELSLGFTPGAPDWSPDGKKIAMTRIEGANKSTIEFQKGAIAYIEQQGNAWAAPVTVVPAVDGKSRYNPNFLPGSKYLLYSESSAIDNAGDGYADPSAKTWVAEAKADAPPLLLAKATAPGVADLADQGTRGLKDGLLMDTFPRSTPFETKHRGGKLLWFTVSSQRRAGLRKVFLNGSAVGDPPTQQLLWMFALDPARLDAGEDGSRPGFFLPFQDLKSSNHLAQWTEKLVSDTPPPPPPTPPPPPPPPAPKPVK